MQEGHKSALHISAHGDMMRREGEALTEMVRHTEDPMGAVQNDGSVTVVAPAASSSEEVKMEELTEECLQDEPTSECMEKFGSYGIRKLFTETWANIKELGYLRPGWMSHPEVQKRHLYSVTFPGTANSGTFSIVGQDVLQASATQFGIISQNLDFYQQLQLGVRAFDIKVAYSAEAKLVYISHGNLLMPLATALRDMKRFLEEHERELIILDVRKDTSADITHTQPLTDEETTASKIPGQMVHEAVQCELKQMLTTYSVLTQLPATVEAENPTIGALTDIGAHVVYFYDGQQVLCTSWDECQRTPGWNHYSSVAGSHPFAFGPPFFPLGQRRKMSGGREDSETIRIIEPSCMTHSTFYTQSDQPEKLMGKVKEYSAAQPKTTHEHDAANCFPVGVDYPVEHVPTIMYTVDGYVVPTPEELTRQTERMRGVKAIYTRGEGYTARTDAERANYLMLTWYLKKNNHQVFTKPNVVLFEFAGSAAMPIIRIIEAMQNRAECGFALYCKPSGSCWADTLLGDEDGKCFPEEEVVKKLDEHANGKTDTTGWVITVTLATVSLVGGCGFIYCMSKIAVLFKSKKKKGEPLKEASSDENVDQPSDAPSNEAQDEPKDEPQDEKEQDKKKHDKKEHDPRAP
jgi:hypothetical protein